MAPRTNPRPAAIAKVAYGRVSMDSLTLDISTLPAAMLKPGDFVELLGPHQSIDDVAMAAGTIGYEILTSLGGRYQRRYLD